MRADWTLTRVLEARRSRRHHSDEPLTRGQLGEFLFRTAALRSVREDDGSTHRKRVYPSGGSVYALELYLAVRQCSGIEPGLYRYDPARHDLRRVATLTTPVQALLAGAARAARASLPQVLIVIAGRFALGAGKYSSISYSLALKEVGALMQTMYLVATAMGLGACAIGGGDADLFAKAAGMDYYVEGSIGEFILGRPAQSRR
jgi:SagB-type dehydrogenase family enzyme